MKMSIFLIRVDGFGCWLGRGREKRGGGQWAAGEGRRIGRRNGREKKRKKQIKKHPKTPTPNPQNHETSPQERKKNHPQRFKPCRKSTNHIFHIPTSQPKATVPKQHLSRPSFPNSQVVELERTSEVDS